MKRIEITETIQRNVTFYIGKADPRVLLSLADDIQIGETQDAQRPLEKKHLEEIAKYIGEENGILPTSILISTRQVNPNGKQLKIIKESVTVKYNDGAESQEVRCYVEIPSTTKERNQYRGTIDIIDGQHRLFSFKDGIRYTSLKDDDTFEIAFCLFVTPKLRERQQLFMVTNEKQKAVSGNLLLWLREKLGLLDDNEQRFYSVVSSLNTEDCSPLKGRIIQSAERIPKGYKAKELIKIMGKAFPENNIIINQALTDNEKKIDAICRYLHGWEQYYDVSFQRPGKETITKISGLRYILWWFPTVWEQAVTKERALDDAFIAEMIKEIQDSLGSTRDIFDYSESFRGEGATDKAVKDHINLWKAYHASLQHAQPFNPLL